MCLDLSLKSWWGCWRLYAALFAKYSLREMKCVGFFRSWVDICVTQAFYFVRQLHIDLGLFTCQNSINANVFRHTTPPKQIIILVNIFHSVSLLIGRSNAYAYESMLCLVVVPVVFFAVVRCCVQFCVWDLIRLYIVFYFIMNFVLLYRMTKFCFIIQDDTKKTETFEKPNKNWRNPRKKIYWQKLDHYNLPFKRQ